MLIRVFVGRTPMHVAAQAGHLDCIKCLLHYKSPLDIQDASSMTPLHYAGKLLLILNAIRF